MNEAETCRTLVRKSFRRLVLKAGFDEGLYPRDDAVRFVATWIITF